MIITFSRKPSTRFTERVRAALVFDEDWTFLAEALDAKVRAGKLIEYMKTCAQNGSYISDDIVSYIMCGQDFDAFAKEITKKEN
jgi:hypothetical protein